MKYDYLPSTVITRFMLNFRRDIIKGMQWRYGVILQSETFNCKAKVKSNEQDRDITITVQGELRRKREYFSAIRHAIDNINKDFENLIVEEYIPLPRCQNNLVKFKSMLGYEKAGRDDYFDGELEKSFSVSELLDSIISKEERIKHQYPLSEDMINKVYKRLDKLDKKVDTVTDSILSKIEIESRNTVGIILNKLDEKEKKIVDLIYQEIENTEISNKEMLQVLLEANDLIERLQNVDENIKNISAKLNSGSDSISQKFKLIVPIIPLFLRYEQEIKVDSALNKFWKKWSNVLI